MCPTQPFTQRALLFTVALDMITQLMNSLDFVNTYTAFPYACPPQFADVSNETFIQLVLRCCRTPVWRGHGVDRYRTDNTLLHFVDLSDLT